MADFAIVVRPLRVGLMIERNVTHFGRKDDMLRGRLLRRKRVKTGNGDDREEKRAEVSHDTDYTFR